MLYDYLLDGSRNTRSLYSCCSANEDVLRAAMLRAKQTNSPLLVESTANQVNQSGGYTGMTPVLFRKYVENLASESGVDTDQIFLGGDHLGPLPWANTEQDQAMENAENLVRDYVSAGFEKIHLDTSMRLASDDLSEPLSISTCARRGAQLCAACEREYERDFKRKSNLVYVIGSEVPIPGGTSESNLSSSVTSVESFNMTVEEYRKEFHRIGLDEAFSRIVAIVVEMGGEFSEYAINDYDRTAFAPLAKCSRSKRIRFEAHSTDYQTRGRLRQMVEDGALFLKVGPALTFEARSSLFKLELIERELVEEGKRSHFRKVLDQAMKENPSNWEKYYGGTETQKSFARAFSFSDRCRYYLNNPLVQASRDALFSNLANNPLPDCLLASLFPAQYRKIRDGVLDSSAPSVLYDSIGEVIDDYLFATGFIR